MAALPSTKSTAASKDLEGLVRKLQGDVEDLTREKEELQKQASQQQAETPEDERSRSSRLESQIAQLQKKNEELAREKAELEAAMQHQVEFLEPTLALQAKNEEAAREEIEVGREKRRSWQIAVQLPKVELLEDKVPESTQLGSQIAELQRAKEDLTREKMHILEAKASQSSELGSQIAQLQRDNEELTREKAELEVAMQHQVEFLEPTVLLQAKNEEQQLGQGGDWAALGQMGRRRPIWDAAREQMADVWERQMSWLPSWQDAPPQVQPKASQAQLLLACVVCHGPLFRDLPLFLKALPCTAPASDAVYVAWARRARRASRAVCSVLLSRRR